MRNSAVWSAALTVAMAIPAAGDAAAETTFYVSTGGNDAHSGRLAEPNNDGSDGPWASIARARQAVRELRRGGKLPAAVTVRIRGVHRLGRPIVLEPEDSGTAECPVTYTAYPGEKPVLSGGQSITGWEKGPDKLWTVTLPEVKAGKWYFRQLFVNQ